MRPVEPDALDVLPRRDAHVLTEVPLQRPRAQAGRGAEPSQRQVAGRLALNQIDGPPHRKLGEEDFVRWLANSVVVAVFVTAGRVLLDSMAGYALARLRFRGRGAVFAAVVAVMAVPNVVLLIPKFLVLKQLGIYDSYLGLILPLMTDAAGVFIMRQFFLSVHPSIEEAARIDGAGIFRTYWSVVLPMARPALITLTILSFQGSWNNFSDVLVAHQSPSLDTLTTGIGRMVSGQLGAGTQYPLQLAAAIAMTVPVAVLFFLFQKYIMRTGQGAIKE